jgi:hypothetical protein
VQHAADFLVAADDGVQFAAFGLFGEVDGVFLEGVVGVLGGLLGHLAAFAQFLDGGGKGVKRSAVFAQQACGFVIAFGDAEQEEFEGNVLVAVVFEQGFGGGNGLCWLRW